MCPRAAAFREHQFLYFQPGNFNQFCSFPKCGVTVNNVSISCQLSRDATLDSVIHGPVLHKKDFFTSLATAKTEFEMLSNKD